MKKVEGGGFSHSRKLKNRLRFVGMTFLFLFTITCSMTSMILAALSAGVGSSFSIVYQPTTPQEPTRPSTELYSLTEGSACQMLDYALGYDCNCVIFDYSDNTELVEALLSGGTWDGVKYSGNTITFDRMNDVEIFYSFDLRCACFISDCNIFAPEDATNYFEIVFNYFPYAQLYLNNFHTDYVAYANGMFAGASCNLNLSDMDFSNASARGMFDGCSGNVYISESLLNNPAINNPDLNPELYDSTHDENGNIHMTAGTWDGNNMRVDPSTGSQFLLPAIDLNVLANYLSAMRMGIVSVNMLTYSLGVVFDNYTAPGEYTDANGDVIVSNYMPTNQLAMCVDMTGWGNAGMFMKKDAIKVYASLGDDGNPDHVIYSGVYVLSNKPIYIINAGEDDVQQRILQAFYQSGNELFTSIFNNFNTDYAL